MASQGPRALATTLLFLNLAMYVIVVLIAGWAANFGIKHAYARAYGMLPARIFPIYFPIGNMATGFFVFFSLIAGVVGIASSLAGIQDIRQWTVSSLTSAASSAIISWSLTLLAMGLACKEINLKGRTPSLRALEAFTIILSGTQLFYTGAIFAGVTTADR